MNNFHYLSYIIQFIYGEFTEGVGLIQSLGFVLTPQ